MWNPRGDYELVDLGEGFSLVKFTCVEDFQKVMDEGPWILFGHYLTIKKWQPDFRADHATIDSTAVWVRFQF